MHFKQAPFPLNYISSPSSLSSHLLSFKRIYLLLLCLYMHAVRGSPCEGPHVEVRDNFMESALSVHVYMGSGDRTYATRLAQQMLLHAEPPH